MNPPPLNLPEALSPTVLIVLTGGIFVLAAVVLPLVLAGAYLVRRRRPSRRVWVVCMVAAGLGTVVAVGIIAVNDIAVRHIRVAFAHGQGLRQGAETDEWIEFESDRTASGGWQRIRVHKPRPQIVERLSGVAMAMLVAGLLLYVPTRFVRQQTATATAV